MTQEHKQNKTICDKCGHEVKSLELDNLRMINAMIQFFREKGYMPELGELNVWRRKKGI